jgi:tryptophanyl-tRNA synthetase
MYRPAYVPVGQDQLPHIEMTREIARRFNHMYDCSIFTEPEGKLTPEAKLPGLDGRKMSKSYNNGIFLREGMEDIQPKVRSMLTDKNRLRRNDPGDPDICNLFPYHVLMTSEEKQAEIRKGCTSAGLGCVDCKKILLESMEEFLAPIQERRRAIDANPKLVQEVLEHGNERARAMARETMEMVRSAINFDF